MAAAVYWKHGCEATLLLCAPEEPHLCFFWLLVAAKLLPSRNNYIREYLIAFVLSTAFLCSPLITLSHHFNSRSRGTV